MKMKIKDTVLAVLAIVCFFLLFGLLVAFNIHTEDNNGQFKFIKYSGDFKIYYDKETKVEYIKKLGNDGGLTVRLDKDGKPIIYNEKEER